MSVTNVPVLVISMFNSLTIIIDEEDFIGLLTEISFTSETLFQCFNVTIIDDTIFESPSGEVFSVELTQITTDSSTIADQGFTVTGEVTILDSDGIIIIVSPN